MFAFFKRFLYEKRISKKNINFSEFDDVEKAIEQEKHEQEQMLNDIELLNRITYEANRKAALADTPEAYREAKREIEKAKEDIKNFRFLDSVKVEENEICEGTAIDAIKESESLFNTELFKKWCREIFKCIKSGTEEEMKAIKYFMSDEMYDKLVYQAEQFEKDNIDFVTEDLIIQDCKLLDYGNWSSKEEIKVLIKAKMKEYIIHKNSNEILRGDDQKSYEKSVVMTFLKHNAREKEGFMTNCPNCGAETTQTELGRCRYCNTLVFPIRYNWTLTKFETMC